MADRDLGGTSPEEDVVAITGVVPDSDQMR